MQRTHEGWGTQISNFTQATPAGNSGVALSSWRV
jgi:hypothetical protein